MYFTFVLDILILVLYFFGLSIESVILQGAFLITNVICCIVPGFRVWDLFIEVMKGKGVMVFIENSSVSLVFY